jgi:hypothetical protein
MLNSLKEASKQPQPGHTPISQTPSTLRYQAPKSYVLSFAVCCAVANCHVPCCAVLCCYKPHLSAATELRLDAHLLVPVLALGFDIADIHGPVSFLAHVDVDVGVPA